MFPLLYEFNIFLSDVWTYRQAKENAVKTNYLFSHIVWGIGFTSLCKNYPGKKNKTKIFYYHWRSKKTFIMKESGLLQFSGNSAILMSNLVTGNFHVCVWTSVSFYTGYFRNLWYEFQGTRKQVILLKNMGSETDRSDTRGRFEFSKTLCSGRIKSRI